MMMYGLPDEFTDLSERRQRAIIKYVEAQVEEAKKEMFFDTTITTVAVGVKTANELFGFGRKRISRYAKQWQYDLNDFNQDRDTRAPQLADWLHNIGLSIVDGNLAILDGGDECEEG